MDRLLGTENRSPAHYAAGGIGLAPPPHGQARWSFSTPEGKTGRMPAGLQSLNDTIAFHQGDGRLPARPREPALSLWLHRRPRRSPRCALLVCRNALGAIPGWDQPSGQKVTEDARWERRLAELRDDLASGHDLPRHKKADSEEERVLGVWFACPAHKPPKRRAGPGQGRTAEHSRPRLAGGPCSRQGGRLKPGSDEPTHGRTAAVRRGFPP